MKKWLRHLLWKNVTQDPQYEEVQVACPEITIDGIDEDLYTKLLGEATAAGAQFSGASATFRGCTFDWNYDPPTQTLHATCLKKPFYAGCDFIEKSIRDLVTKAKETGT